MQRQLEPRSVYCHRVEELPLHHALVTSFHNHGTVSNPCHTVSQPSPLHVQKVMENSREAYKSACLETYVLASGMSKPHVPGYHGCRHFTVCLAVMDVGISPCAWLSWM